jgi:hypothetical protein
MSLRNFAMNREIQILNHYQSVRAYLKNWLESGARG